MINYLESNNRFLFLEFHILHFTFNISIAIRSVMLRPLHVFTETD